MTVRASVSLAEFETFLASADRIVELIDGEIVEVPSNPFVSKIAGWILTAINIFLRENDIGHATGEGGGYLVNGHVYAPDVAFISYARQPELARTGYNPNPPDLAVEVISDPGSSQEQATLRRKIVNYLAVGTVVWVVDADAQTIEVYNGAAQVYGLDDVISGGAVLPGFSLPLREVFPPSR